MSEQRYQVQVGIVFILAVIVLIWGVLWFKDFKIRGTTYDMKVEFDTASGLIKGDPVEVQGVPSGKVAAITFENGRSVVTMQLDDGIKLYPGTKVVLENVGIMGQKLVAVYPGPPAEVLPPGSVPAGRVPARHSPAHVEPGGKHRDLRAAGDAPRHAPGRLRPVRSGGPHPHPSEHRTSHRSARGHPRAQPRRSHRDAQGHAGGDPRVAHRHGGTRRRVGCSSSTAPPRRRVGSTPPW